MDRHSERQEPTARDEIHRGEIMAPEGHRLESQADWQRGEALERQGEKLEQGRQRLTSAERREHINEYREDHR
jgi:hypothetical protein